MDPEFPDDSRRGCTYDGEGVVETDDMVPFPIILVSPADPPSSGEDALWEQSDNITLVKLVGHVELCPFFGSSADFVATVAGDPDKTLFYSTLQNSLQNYHVRAALSKDKWIFNPPPAGQNVGSYGVVPRYPLDTNEWTDAQFLRQWERTRARATTTLQAMQNGDAPLGCCSDVSAPAAGAPANTLSNGSGTVNIPAISTECTPCGTDAAGTFRFGGSSATALPCFRLSLNSRRRLTFKENEGLTLWLDWTSFTPVEYGGAPDWRPNVGFYARLFGRALVERA